MSDEKLSIADAAQELGWSYHQVWYAIIAGKLAGGRDSRGPFVLRSAVKSKVA